MKRLPPDDFRYGRLILEPDDFALGSDIPDPPASDLIDKETWESLVSLPDDVAVRTSDHYGSTLAALYANAGEWTCMVGAIQETLQHREESPIAHAAGDAADEFQASIYNALVGFYRVAFSCLRNVLELMTLGLQFELSKDATAFESWVRGQSYPNFGWAADLLPKQNVIASVEKQLVEKTGNDLFKQYMLNSQGGFARRLFVELSRFAHAAPTYTDAAIRRSNGPIFVPDAFESWTADFATTFCLCLAFARLGRSDIDRLAWGSNLTIVRLYKRVLKHVPANADGADLLRMLPSILW